MFKIELGLPLLGCVGLVYLTVALYLFYAQANENDKPFPPSPKGLPVIGHSHLLRNVKYTWRTMHELAMSLGDPTKPGDMAGVMMLRLGTSNTVVVSTAQAQTDLLEKQGGITASRPEMKVPTELISNNRRMVLLGYNQKWRTARKFLHSVLFDKAAKTYEPIQEREAKCMMFSMLQDPKSFADHFQLFSSNIILQISFNRRATNVQDKDIQALLQDADEWMQSANPSYHPVHDFPILDYLPNFLAPWRAHAARIHANELKLYESLSSKVREEMARGETPDVVMRYCLERKEELGMDDEDVLYVAGTLFEAGSETTTSILMSLFLACAMDPDICRQAQEEVDRVVGHDRMPSFVDYGHLPFIEAIADELQRWRPTTPNAVPHRSTEDIVYNGYYIPKGTTIIGNTWAIGRDISVFPDGDKFRPSRYMPGEERDRIFKALSRGHSAWGFGRRVCIGLHLANRSLHIAIANLFWGFDVLPTENGKMPESYNYSSGFVTHAKPFDVLVRPRSVEKSEIIRAEGKQARSEVGADFEHEVQA